MKILVVGDLMLDHYIFGRVNRISPEAPVPVVEVSHESDMLGGCGNVIQNLYNLKIDIEILSALGSDNNGKKIISRLKKMKINTSSVFCSEMIKTNYKMRIVANNQHIVRTDWDNSTIDSNTESVIKKSISDLVNEADGIVISDYDKGVCTESILKNIINKSIKLNKPVIIDPKGDNWKKYSGATFITPNIKEVSLLIKSPLKSDNDFILAGKEIINKYNIENCLITRGADGMTLITKNSKFHVKSNAQEVYDVSGAGDTVVACLSAAILQGKSKKESIEFANKAAGIVVSHVGTSAITLEELK